MQNTEQNAVLLRLAREYGDSVVRMCCVYLKDYHLAQDVAQETFLQACPVHSFVYFANKNARVGVRDARIYTDETSLRRAIQSAPEPGRPVDAARLAALLEQACE